MLNKHKAEDRGQANGIASLIRTVGISVGFALISTVGAIGLILFGNDPIKSCQLVFITMIIIALIGLPFGKMLGNDHLEGDIGHIEI
jgi:hypothetical protein